MFQFPGFASAYGGYHIFNMVGFPIRKFADQIVCADPRDLSQLITSFIASESLGIPHTPLFCLLYLHFKVLRKRNTPKNLCFLLYF